MRKVIKAILEKTSMTQRELAREVGCSQPLLCKINTGKCRDVSYSLGKRIIAFAESKGIQTSDTL